MSTWTNLKCIMQNERLDNKRLHTIEFIENFKIVETL